MKYLVSLINDHVLSAYLFIKENKDKYDEILLFTTPRSTGRVKRIRKLLPNETLKHIEILGDDFFSDRSELKKLKFQPDDRIIVHLPYDATIMSLGAFFFFKKEYSKSEFYLVPPGKNMIRNVLTSKEAPLTYRIKVEEYFNLHDIDITWKTGMIFPQEHTYQLFDDYRDADYQWRSIPEMRSAKDKRVKTPKEKYYDGTWFEEYTYHRLIDENDDLKKPGYICTGVKIYRFGLQNPNNDNEIDIAFVIDNELYIGECKVSIGYTSVDVSEYDLLEEYLYKLAALSIDFGLNVRQMVFTLWKFTDPRSIGLIERRMEILQLERLIEREHFESEEKLPIKLKEEEFEIFSY